MRFELCAQKYFGYLKIEGWNDLILIKWWECIALYFHGRFTLVLAYELRVLFVWSNNTMYEFYQCVKNGIIDIRHVQKSELPSIISLSWPRTRSCHIKKQRSLAIFELIEYNNKITMIHIFYWNLLFLNHFSQCCSYFAADIVVLAQIK